MHSGAYLCYPGRFKMGSCNACAHDGAQSGLLTAAALRGENVNRYRLSLAQAARPTGELHALLVLRTQLLSRQGALSVNARGERSADGFRRIFRDGEDWRE